jgi:hypothetical protein
MNFLNDFRRDSCCETDIRFLLPNLVSAGFLAVDCLLVFFFLKESNEGSIGKKRRQQNMWQYLTGQRTTEITSSHDEQEPLLQEQATPIVNVVSLRRLLTRNILLVISTFGLFSLCIVGYNQLFPIFLSTPSPEGLNMSPEQIGTMLSIAALTSILTQAILFIWMERTLGTIRCYQLGLISFSISFFITPFIKSDNITLWFEIFGIIILKTLAIVLGITCALLLVSLIYIKLM